MFAPLPLYTCYLKDIAGLHYQFQTSRQDQILQGVDDLGTREKGTSRSVSLAEGYKYPPYLFNLLSQLSLQQYGESILHFLFDSAPCLLRKPD